MFGHQDNTDQTTKPSDAGPDPATTDSALVSAPAVGPAGDSYLVSPQPSVSPATVATAPTQPAPAANDVNPAIAAHEAAASGTNDLLDLKQSALQQLSPLLDHLDQSPEEKFRTTMMMIQAADDQSLLHTAYDAAQHITDEKTRAQALLDIVNEINYFTQQADN